jgi:tetratricopeptide (TPR) repeat protein
MTQRPAPLASIALPILLAAAAVSVLASCAGSGSAAREAGIVGTPAALREAVALSQRAAREYDDGEYDRAADLYRRSLALNPNFSAGWNNLGITLMAQSNYVDAVEAFRRAAQLEPTDPRPYENAGLAYLELGWSEEALRFYTQALERNPTWLPALRGSMVASKNLLRVERDALDVVRRGLLAETDPAWRELFQRERMRLEQALAESRPQR